jgi:hypothetical protein
MYLVKRRETLIISKCLAVYASITAVIILEKDRRLASLQSYKYPYESSQYLHNILNVEYRSS